MAKDNIISFNFEAEDYLTIKDIFAKALKEFNSKHDKFKLITDDFSLFKLRVGKKSGMPDLDLPGINRLI